MGAADTSTTNDGLVSPITWLREMDAARATKLLSAVGLILLMDLIRVWFPSVIFIYGDAGSTPAVEMGLFALAIFAIGIVGARATVVAPRWALLTTTVVLVASRISLLATDGGFAQLAVASAGVIAGIGWLGALASTIDDDVAVSRGFAGAMIGGASLHMLLRTVDGAWANDNIGWAIAVALGGLMAMAAVVLADAFLLRREAKRARRGARVLWLIVGPLILLHGMVGAAPGRLRVGLFEDEAATAGLIVLAHGAGWLLGRLLTSSWARESAGVLIAALMGLAGGAAMFDDPTAMVISTLAAAIVVPAAILIAGVSDPDVGVQATIAQRLSERDQAREEARQRAGDDINLVRQAATSRATPAGVGMFAFLVAGFAYYASYDTSIGIPRGAVLGILFLLVAGFLARIKVNPSHAHPNPPHRDEIGLMGALALGVAAVVLASGTSGVVTIDGDGFPVRVMTYNVHMGFDTEGRFDVQALAEVVDAEAPDILVLNEVDRGWLLNGGHDLLPLIAHELDMPYRFGGAADSIWGNAILSRLPISDVEVTALPSGGAPMDRSALSAIVDIGGGQQLAIIATHLHHVNEDPRIRLEQATVLASLTQEQESAGRIVVLMGDLNAEPGDEELDPLASRLRDAVADASNGTSTATFPSTAPTRQIDHILVSAGLRASALSVRQSLASDHLGVALTLR